MNKQDSAFYVAFSEAFPIPSRTGGFLCIHDTGMILIKKDDEKNVKSLTTLKDMQYTCYTFILSVYELNVKKNEALVIDLFQSKIFFFMEPVQKNLIGIFILIGARAGNAVMSQSIL